MERDPSPVHKAARLIMSMQLGSGDFPQEVTATMRHALHNLNRSLEYDFFNAIIK